MFNGLNRLYGWCISKCLACRVEEERSFLAVKVTLCQQKAIPGLDLTGKGKQPAGAQSPKEPLSGPHICL